MTSSTSTQDIKPLRHRQVYRIIRLNNLQLMCHADVEVALYQWRETRDNPFPDLGMHKVCRDFEALLEWQDEVELKHEPELWCLPQYIKTMVEV